MRITSTNSGMDSKGVVRLGNLELEGDTYLYLVVGAVLGLLIFILTAQHGWLARLLFAGIPLGLAGAWMKFFVMGRPPHFQSDFFERKLVGRNFGLRPQEWAKTTHPRGNRVRGT